MTRWMKGWEKRIAVALIVGAALSLSLSACGKKGPPEKPDPTYPHTYPRQ